MNAETAINKAIEKVDNWITINNRMLDSAKTQKSVNMLSAKLVAYSAVKRDLTAILNEILNG